MQYIKMFAQVAAASLSAAIAAMTGDQTISPEEWLNIAIIGVGAAGVFTAPNAPHATATKAVLSILSTVLAGLVAVITGGITSTEWLQVAMAACGTVFVYLVPNSEVAAAAEPAERV